MWIVNIEKECDKPIIRYAVKTFIYHLGVLPLNSDLYLNVGEVIENNYSGICINFLNSDCDISEFENKIDVNIDFLNDIGDFLSLKYEEGAQLDSFGRVRFSVLSEKIQKKLSESFIDIKIDEIREKIVRVCAKNEVEILSNRPWDKKTIVLSHDVDDLFGKSILRYLYWSLKQPGRFKNNLKRIQWWLEQKEDPYFSPIKMSEIEGEFGFKSTFYFMAKSAYLTFDEGRRYNVQSNKVKRLIREIEAKGWEVGFHPSRETFYSSKKLRQEFYSLKKASNSIIGARRHYLKGTFPEIWRELQDIDMAYDTSVGWPDRFGSRVGTNRPFRAFDYKEDLEMTIYEFPLTFMDGTLKYESDQQYVKDYLSIEKELMNSGCLSFLWHTDRFCNEIFNPSWMYIYTEILKSWHANGYRVISSKELIDEYRTHEEKFEIKFNNETWKD